MRLQLSRVFSERVFTTNKDVNFFFRRGFLFLFRALHQMPFHTRKSPVWMSCQWFCPLDNHLRPMLSHFIFILSPSLAAAFGCCLFYGTDDYVLPGVLSPWCSVLGLSCPGRGNLGHIRYAAGRGVGHFVFGLMRPTN